MLLKTRDLVTMGVLLAINQIFIILATIIETNTLMLFALAAVILYVVMDEYEFKSGMLFYIASCILGFLLAANKVQIFTYIILLAPYVIIHYKTKNIFIRILLGNILLVVFYIFMRGFIVIDFKIWYILVIELGMIVYDFALLFSMQIYDEKIKKNISK